MNLTEKIFNADAVVTSYRESEDINNQLPMLGAGLFPDRRTNNIKLESISRHKPIEVQLAASNFDAMPTLRTRGTFNLESKEMAFFRESMLVREYDLLMLQNIESVNNPTFNEIMRSIYDDTNELLRGAAIVPEIMRMQLLAPVEDGSPKILIKDNDVTYAYNYDVDESYKTNNYIALTSDDTWDKPETAKPFDNFRTVKSKLAEKGYRPAYALMSQKTFDMLLAMQSVRDVILAQNSTAMIDVDDSIVQRVWSAKTQTRIIVYDKMYYDKEQKKVVPFYPDGYVTFLPEGPLGATWRGVTPEERTARGFRDVDVRVMPDGVAVAVKNEYGPPAKTTTTASMIVLPSYDRMEETFVLKVTEGE